MSETQNRILKTLFVYRYLTNAYLSDYLSISGRTCQRNTQLLEAEGYITHVKLDNFDKTKYYFITTSGLKYLKRNYSDIFDERALLRLRRAKPTRSLIEKSGRIARLALKVKKEDSSRAIFTDMFLVNKNMEDIADFSPQLFTIGDESIRLYYFVNDTSPDYVNYRLMRKLFKQSIDILAGEYGVVYFVLVANTKSLQTRLQKKLAYIEDRSLTERNVSIEYLE